MSDSIIRPSKQFIIRGSIAIAIIVILLVVQSAWFKNLFHKKAAQSPKAVTVGDVIDSDSNGNGIPDWEEKLWGLDPTVLYTNGVSNKEIIEEKKKALGVSDTTDQNLSDNDRLARELFTLTSALGQSDQVDDQTLQAIAAKLGSSIDIKQVSNHYSLKDVQTVSTTSLSLKTYSTTMTKLLSNYDTNTADIDVIINALQTGDTSRLSELSDTATAYTQIAKKMMGIKVPVGVADYHLAIANGFAGIAQSFTYLQQMNDSDVTSLVGVAIYKTYNEKIANALASMRAYFTRYGILS